MASRARSPAARLPALYMCELAGAASSSAPRSKRTRGSEWGGRRGAGVAGGGVAATLETANISGERSEGNPLIVGISGMPSAAVVGNARLACGSVRRRSAPAKTQPYSAERWAVASARSPIRRWSGDEPGQARCGFCTAATWGRVLSARAAHGVEAAPARRAFPASGRFSPTRTVAAWRRFAGPSR